MISQLLIKQNAVNVILSDIVYIEVGETADPPYTMQVDILTLRTIF